MLYVKSVPWLKTCVHRCRSRTASFFFICRKGSNHQRNLIGDLNLLAVTQHRSGVSNALTITFAFVIEVQVQSSPWPLSIVQLPLLVRVSMQFHAVASNTYVCFS